MTIFGFVNISFFVLLLFLIAKPFGIYMKKVFCRERTFLDFLFTPVEKTIYKVCGVDKTVEHNWKEYFVNLLLFSFFGFILLLVLQGIQFYLPFNPEGLKGVSSLLSLNTAISFVTNTNWQAYAGQSTLSYFVQMAGCSLQQFLSAATGISVAIALTRSFSRKETDRVGNFWVDVTRASLWILLPLSIIIAIFYISQGVPQNLSAYVTAQTLEAGKQVIPQGPVASFEAIKSLGTNGGGFFSANSMHPYENPNALTNFIQCLSIFSIGVGLTYTFGLMAGNRRQGWTILISMMILFFSLTCLMYFFESRGNPRINEADHLLSRSMKHYGQNMEGKEVRFGIDDSILYASVTTSASNGGVNAQMETLNPLSGGIAMFNMALGEIIVGGVGAGLYGVLKFVLLTVFIAGLMVGRSPEFLGKKISTTETKYVMISLLVSPFCALFFTALTCFIPSVLKEFTSFGPHGFSRILYTFLSTANNNGSAFGGIEANTAYFNVTTGIAMLLGRFVTIGCVLAIAGSIVQKKSVPSTAGTFPTTGAIFVVMLILCILLIGGLNFFPALALGPVAEHLLLF